MARQIHKLTDIKVRSLKEGRHSDGGGLYLRVSATGARSWSFMFNRNGIRQEIGLGAYPAITLAMARKLATENRELVAIGKTPRRPADEQETDKTFEEVVELFLDSMESQWSNPKHRAQWKMTLGPAYCKRLLKRRIADIELDDILQTLKPHWKKTPETASRLRGRLERILNFAKAQGWRSGENPAQWCGSLEAILPKPQKLARGHMKAMPFEELPAFFQDLKSTNTISARALEFLMLTASRSGEVLGAKWHEIDLDTKIWTIPDWRMKARREHRVPLSEAAIEILLPLQDAKVSEFVFPGSKSQKGMSDMTLTQLLRRRGRTETVHGMRSGFRDWAGDKTLFARELAEASLAHAVGDATERAYRRGDAIERRRELMEAWASYLSQDDQSNVVNFPKGATS